MPFTVRQLLYGDIVVIRRYYNASGSSFDKLTVQSGGWLSWAGGATAFSEAQWTILDNGGKASGKSVKAFSAGTTVFDSNAGNSRLVLTENFAFDKDKSWTQSNNILCDKEAHIQLSSKKGKLLFRTSPTKSTLYSNTPFRIGRPDNKWQLQNCGGRTVFAPGNFNAGFDVYAVLASDACLSCTTESVCANCPNCQDHPPCAPLPCQCLTVGDCETCENCAGNPICDTAECVCEPDGRNCVSCKLCEGSGNCSLPPYGAGFVYGDRAVFEAIPDIAGPAAQLRLLPASGGIELAETPATGTVVRLTNPASQAPGGVIQAASHGVQATEAQTFVLSHSTRYVQVSDTADAVCGTLLERYLTCPTTAISSAVQLALELIAPPGQSIGQTTAGVRVGGLYRLRGIRGADSLVAWRCNLSNSVFWGPESSVPSGAAVLHFRVFRVNPFEYVCPDMSVPNPPAKLDCAFIPDCDPVAQTGCASNSVCTADRTCSILVMPCTNTSCPAFHFCDDQGMCLDEREHTPPTQTLPDGASCSPDSGLKCATGLVCSEELRVCVADPVIPPNQTLPIGAMCNPDSSVKCATGLVCSEELRVCVTDPGTPASDKKRSFLGVIGGVLAILIIGVVMLFVVRRSRKKAREQNVEAETAQLRSS